MPSLGTLDLDERLAVARNQIQEDYLLSPPPPQVHTQVLPKEGTLSRMTTTKKETHIESWEHQHINIYRFINMRSMYQYKKSETPLSCSIRIRRGCIWRWRVEKSTNTYIKNAAHIPHCGRPHVGIRFTQLGPRQCGIRLQHFIMYRPLNYSKLQIHPPDEVVGQCNRR